MEWNCPECNTNNDESISRCTCGYDLNRVESPLHLLDESRVSRPKSDNGMRNKLLIGFAAICGVIALFFMFAPNERINSVKEAWLRIKKDPAQRCLDTARKNLLDPDSARIISFSYIQKEYAYVLKYRSKNSYGAYVQGVFFCDSSGDEDNSIERLTKKIEDENKLLRQLKGK